MRAWLINETSLGGAGRSLALAMLVVGFGIAFAGCSTEPTPGPTPGRPRANAGSDRNVDVGGSVSIDGSGSTGSSLTYSWQRIYRKGKSAAPVSHNLVRFHFTLDEPDSLEYELTVSSGVASDKDTMVVRSNPPTISTINPTTAPVGGTVVISGTNFSPTPGQNEVLFNGVTATVTAASITQLSVTCPPTATTGPISVKVIGTGDLALGPTFTVGTAPVADAGSDHFVDVGASVTLDGSGSAGNSLTYTWARLTQLGQSAAPPSGSGITLGFTLDEPDSLEYELTVSDGTLNDTDTVVVRSNPPTITSITPTSGAPGTSVTIDGTNFSPTAGQNVVFFNILQAHTITSTSATQLVADVPAGATTGPVSVLVTSTSDLAVGPIFTVPVASGWLLQYSGQASFGLKGVSVISLDTVVAVGNNQRILRTIDGGTTWSPQVSPATVGALFDVYFTNPLIGTAVGTGTVSGFGGGLILRSTDGGVSWAPMHSLSDSVIRNRVYAAVSFTTPDTGTVVGNVVGSPSPAILRTTDGGTTWTKQTSPVNSGFLNDVHFIDANNGVIVGGSAGNPLVLHTTDGGANWTQQSLPVASATLLGVFFVDATTGWAVGAKAGGSPVILKTSNAGASWTEQGVGLGGVQFTDVFFTDATTGTVVSPSPQLQIYRTANGGATWTQELRNDGAAAGGWAVGFANTDVGYVVGPNELIFRRIP